MMTPSAPVVRTKCSCEKMSRLLTALGAKHAAKMHKEIGREWSVDDWLMHFAEEDRYVLPHLPRAVADRIFREHEIMRAEIRMFGTIRSWAMLDEHSKLEDTVVIQYLGHLVD